MIARIQIGSQFEFVIVWSLCIEYKEAVFAGM